MLLQLTAHTSAKLFHWNPLWHAHIAESFVETPAALGSAVQFRWHAPALLIHMVGDEHLQVRLVPVLVEYLIAEQLYTHPV